MRDHCALLVYDFRASGVVRNLLRIAAAAREAGLDIELWPIRAQGELLGQVPPGVRVRPILAGRSRASRELDSLRAIPALARAIDRRRPRLLFSSGNHSHLHAALALLFVGERSRVRFVGRASNAVVSKGVGLARWRRLAGPLERFQYRSMDRIVAVSAELACALADDLGIDAGRIVTIPNGVDVAAIEAAAAAPAAHRFFAEGAPPIILGIGRLSRQKNFEGLVRAFARLRAARPARLIVLGAGGARRLRRLKALAKRLGVGDDVDFAGFVPNPAAILARASLFVLSSRWEGASNVILEALACGCPVVATRVPTGVAEVLGAGGIAPLVPAGDDRALAEAMSGRLDRPRASPALRARARAYDLSRTLAHYVDLLRCGSR